jgi:organic hydroperoxide reductase OsmC/OhrA
MQTNGDRLMKFCACWSSTFRHFLAAREFTAGNKLLSACSSDMTKSGFGSNSSINFSPQTILKQSVRQKLLTTTSAICFFSLK